MDDIIGENDLMKRCSDCGILKMKTDFYFRNINQKLRKECVLCTKMKQKVHDSENREKIKSYKKQNIQQNKGRINEYKKHYVKNRFKTDVNYRFIVYTKNRIYKSLKGMMKQSSSRDILGIDIYFYKKWIESQFTPEMNWSNIEIDHVKPICLFDVSKDEELGEVFNWKNIQSLLKHDHQQKGIKFFFLDYQIQIVKAYQFLRLNEEALTKIFINEIYSIPPRKNYPTNKIVYNHIDDIWSIDLTDMMGYKISNNKGFKYTFVIVDNFSKNLCAIPLKNKNSQTITNEFSNKLTTSKRKPLKIETDRGSEFYNSIFQNFLRNKNIHHYSRFRDKGPSIAERVIRTLRNLLKKPLFLVGNANWISELPSVIKQFNNTFHYSIKMTPIQASKKVNEKEVFSNLKDNREIQKPKLKLGQLVRTADIRKVFSKAIQQIGLISYIQ